MGFPSDIQGWIDCLSFLVARDEFLATGHGSREPSLASTSTTHSNIMLLLLYLKRISIYVLKKTTYTLIIFIDIGFFAILRTILEREPWQFLSTTFSFTESIISPSSSSTLKHEEIIIVNVCSTFYEETRICNEIITFSAATLPSRICVITAFPSTNLKQKNNWLVDTNNGSILFLAS